ncbi:MAG: ATP-binding protein [Deltaproteobacteria bacterium]|nr:ATP-binding protein [Deltaproteobacteria bacterium]MCL5277966.1 ATP-binding protein [Deltaproteobacteria bacterium]
MKHYTDIPSPEPPIEKQELLSRLYWSTGIRLTIVTLLIGLAVTIYRYRAVFSTLPWLSPLIILIVALYVLSLVELLTLRKQEALKSMAYFVTALDAVFVSSIVTMTGGIDSIYTFLYLFVAMEGGFLLSKKGALMFASLSSILYGLLVDVQYYRLLPSLIPPSQLFTSARGTLVNMITYMSTMFIVGVLSAFLGDSLTRAKKALSASSTDLIRLKNLHTIIIDSIDTGLITLDASDRISTMNPAACHITGYSIGEVAGKVIEDILPGIQLKDFTIKRNELGIRRKDGTSIQIGYTISNLYKGTARPIGMVIAFQDLSEMKKMEARLKRADILVTAGRLAASVAHEIRNPLASISGMIQLLREDLGDNERFEKPLGLVFREVDRINNLVTEFLSMSKPVTNIQEGVMLKPIVDEVFESVMERVDYNPSVTMLNAVADRTSIRADTLKMKQILLNLVLNAIHAIREAGTVTVECIERDSDVSILVKDNGQGMDEDEIRSSTEPFWTTNPGGTGLGLPVVQSIVEQHNGALSIQSKKGAGTTVEVRLPL